MVDKASEQSQLSHKTKYIVYILISLFTENLKSWNLLFECNMSRIIIPFEFYKQQQIAWNKQTNDILSNLKLHIK